MADIPANIDKINDIEVALDAPITEQLFNKIGANINALIDLTGGINFRFYEANDTWTKPSSLSKILVFLTGPGGNGGSGATNPSGVSFGNSRGGGGAGATVIKLIDASLLSSTESIVIGSPGVNSTFGSLVTAAFGASAPAANGQFGAGGVASGGDLNVNGGDGHIGTLTGSTNGASGGGVNLNGHGGASFFGGGGKAGVGATAGLAGKAYGSGGAGGSTGGAGKNGVCIIIEMFSAL